MLRNFKLTTIFLFNILLTSTVYSKRRNLVDFVDRDGPQTGQDQDPTYKSNLRSPANAYAGVDYGSMEYLKGNNEHCWLTLNAKQHFETMDALDEKYAAARQDFEEKVEADNSQHDATLLQHMLNTRGRVSGRTRDMNEMPAGLNLGGYCMMKMNKSVLFFHRMKLRNNTRFRVNYLRTNFKDMQIVTQLSLNDLHLFGSYERAVHDVDPSILYYAPTFGQVDILLRNVQYKMEGSLRMLEDSLYIVVVNSEIKFYDSLIMFMNNASNSERMMRPLARHIAPFMERLRSDLDEWLRDYFNEQLIMTTKIGKAASEQYREYEKKKIIALNKYVDEAAIFLKARLRQANATNVILPSFSIFAINGMELKLSEGVLRGLDTIYRRSVATCKKEGDVRNVDAIIGFSSLKSIYKYSVFLANGLPPLTGLIILSADELTAHMRVSLVKDPETVDLHFNFIQQMRPESLTVEGSANRMIAGFKHILEYHVITIMMNTLRYNILHLTTLTRCHPRIFGYPDLDGPDIGPGGLAGKIKGGPGGDRIPRIPDYVVQKEDSIEVELPPNDKGESKRVHLLHVESLNITKLNKK